MRQGIRAITTTAVVCLSYCCARAFIHPSTRTGASTEGRRSTSTAAPGVQFPLNNVGTPALWEGHGGGNAEEGERRGEMPSTGDGRHHPSALRNRDFIAAELVKWGGGQDDGAAASGTSSAACMMLEIASGTGCHVEAFAKVLPAWTFQPTEVSRAVPRHRAGDRHRAG